MDGGAWWAVVHGVAKSWTRLRDFTFTFQFRALQKELATHSSSCMENPRDGGAWWAAVYGVAQSRTRLKRLSSSSSSTQCYAAVNSVIHPQQSMMVELLFPGFRVEKTVPDWNRVER